MAGIVLMILWSSFLSVLGIGFISFCLYTAYIYYLHRKYAHLPQAPRTSFYFGHEKYLREGLDENCDKTTDDALYEMHKQLGSPPVFVLHTLHAVVVCVTERKAIKEIAFDTRHTATIMMQSMCSLYGTRFIGRSIFPTFDYEDWHKRRVILNTAFRWKFLKDFMEPFNLSASQFIEKLSEAADGVTQISMLDHFSRCALHVIAKVGYDMDLDIIKNEDASINHQMLKAITGMFVTSNPRHRFDFSAKAKKTKEEVVRAITYLREIARGRIGERIDEMNSGDEVPEDILTYLIKAGQEASGDDRDKMAVMIDEFVTFFIVGQDTTASTMASTILMLGKHPEILRRLQVEVDAVIGDKTYVTFEDINKLEYMMQVIQETLRLWPPFTGNARRIACDVDVEGFNVPAGTNVVMYNYLMTRMEKYYHNANVFDPDRFKLDEDTIQNTFVPFGQGPKSCIGQRFALIEARVVLARFISTFNFTLAPGQDLTLGKQIVMKPKDGCKVLLTHH